MNHQTSPSPARYFYLNNGQQAGPVTGKQLKKLAADGKLSPTDLVWQEGKENRVPAGKVKELFPAKSSAPATTATQPTSKPSVNPPLQRRPAPVKQRRLFLSCVTHEFRSYRDVLATTLAQPGVELRRQEDFVNAGTTTSEKVDEYIRTCDAVIHLVGHGTGAYPVPAEVDALLARWPDIVAKLAKNDLMQPPGLSYTQWEAWLALYHGKPLALYRAADIAQRELGFAQDPAQRQRQQLHWMRLELLGRDRKEFIFPHDLSIEVLRAMPLLVPGFAENVRRGEFRDRNLLFAVLALQDEILSREAFVKVCSLWATDTDQHIAEIMQREGLLTPEDRLLVEARLERKLKARSGDVRRAFAENLGSDVRQTCSEALDPATFASLPDRLAAMGNLTANAGQWRYKLTRTHGSGGLGIVSVAEDTALERKVAVKQIRSERIIDPMAVERFVREARITGRLQHPNIVPVYELGLTPDDQIPFYAMRFVGHRTLLDTITQHYSDKEASATDRNLRFRELLQSFLSVCNAVAFAHDQGVIHRDLKPANVMIGDFGEVILLDWGLAKRLDESDPVVLSETAPTTVTPVDAGQTQTGVKLGSPAYMAPEQASGSIELHGAHTDIYGLGVTLYEILTGDVPFTGTTTEELFSAIQSRPMPDPRERNLSAPLALISICRKAMEKEPAKRYSSAQALVDDIQHWLADEPVSVFAEPIVIRLQRVARKNPGPLSGLAAAILVGIISLTAGLYFVNVERTEKTLAFEREAQQRREADTQKQRAIESSTLAVRRYEELKQQVAKQKFQLAETAFQAGRIREAEKSYIEAALNSPAYTRAAIDRITHSGRLLSNLRTEDFPEVDVLRISFSNTDRFLIGRREIGTQVWECSSGCLIFDSHRVLGKSLNLIDFSKDDQVFATSTEDELRIWNANNGLPISLPLYHNSTIASFAIETDGLYVKLASGVQLSYPSDKWNSQDVTAVRLDNSHRTVEARKASLGAATIAESDGTLSIKDERSGLPIVFENVCHHSAYSDLGNTRTRLAGCGEDQRIRIFANVLSMPVRKHVKWNCKPSSDIKIDADWSLAVVRTAVSPMEMLLIEVQTGKIISHLGEGRHLEPFDLSPNGKYTFTINEHKVSIVGALDGVAKEPILHGATVTAAAFSSNSMKMFTGDETGTIRQFASDSARPAGPEVVVGGVGVSTIAAIPNSDNILVAATHGPLIGWDGRTSKETIEYDGMNDALTRLTVSVNGKYFSRHGHRSTYADIFREQGKPKIWFLPLSESIAPHLDELLGPIATPPQLGSGDQQ